MVEIAESTFTYHNQHFHVIPSKKFKTVNIAVKCKAPLHKDTITKRALLPYILEQGTTKFPSEKKIMQRLDELYGAVLSINSQKKGNHHIVTFRLEVANEKFLPNESNMMQEAFLLLHDIIYDPNKEKGYFPEKIVNREKVSLRNKLKAIQDDKMAYANLRLIDHMCKDELYHIHTNGYEEALPTITHEHMTTYYEKMVAEDEINVYIVGDVEEEEIKEIIQHSFSTKREFKPTAISQQEIVMQVDDPKEIIEKQDIQQAKLHIGYRTNITYQDADYFALHVCNGLFGGFPSSKLFINVREKHSLAYYAASRMESHKGLLIVYSGIEGKEYEKARVIIEKQLKDMQAGQFSEEEVEKTKELVISEIKETLDNSQGIVELLYQQVVGGKEMSPTDFISGIQKVSKANVIRASKKLQLDTVYLLTNHEGSGKQ